VFGGWEIDESAVKARLRRLLESAAPFGVRNATLHLPCYWLMSGGVHFRPESNRREKHLSVVCKVLCEAVRHAALLGIRLNVENCGCHGPCEPTGYCFASAEDLENFLLRLGCDDVGICLDSGHANLACGDPAGMIRRLGGLIGETHLNDNFGVLAGREAAQCDFHRPPGIGSIDWLAVMDAFDAVAYDKPLVFEEGMVQVGGDDFEVLARITHDNWRAFERARAKRDGMDPTVLVSMDKFPRR